MALDCIYWQIKLCSWWLTDGDLVSFSQHDVIGGEVSMDDALLFVQVTQC